ncbi:PREDICTED: maternally expressed PAB C-terminal protein-like [Camelina sativa]|uniref:Maternally expressed PAB C-terminal protein-like n=1 Tax=Camelina sativa TaxID=90675 RepID=A0ABM0W5R8_CAMSA|nr:PREDICTED: maternally expressed PAB C-terminal protein-like [Camelina sativa]
MGRGTFFHAVPVILGSNLPPYRSPPYRPTPKTPEQERQIMSEYLYLLVSDLEPMLAPKITGMLLQMDEDIILDLIGSPEALKEAVKEATKILADWIPQQLKLVKKEAACKFMASIIPKPKL